MQNRERIKRWVAPLILAAAVSPSFAQEMPSRVHLAPVREGVTLRSTSVPPMRIKISPSSRQLSEAAQNASFQEGIAPPLAQVLGIKRPKNPAAPRRVGSVFPTNAGSHVAEWQRQDDGSYVTHIHITSTNALGIRARLRLPEGMTTGEIRVVARDGDIAVVSPLSFSGEGEFWTPYTEGEIQIVEIRTPQNVAGRKIEVIDIGHFEVRLAPLANELPATSGATGAGAAGRCSPDVVCTSNDAALDAAIAERSKSVAMMNFASGGSFFLCTGTLINSPSQQNFFLTANHCISTQAEANSLSTIWFRQASACGIVAGNGQQVTVAGGAQLVFTNQFVDSTLLRLNNPPPSGAVYSAWNASPLAANSAVVSISHPSGDYMKFATGIVSSTIQNRPDGLIRFGQFEQEMYAVLFNRGIIEGGSSGSGLFVLANGSLQLRGMLFGDTTEINVSGLTCTNTAENALYGRFDYFYPQIAPLLNDLSYPPDDYPNQPSATGPALAIGATVTGQLSYVGDLDVFRIPVTQSGTLFAKSSGGYDLIGNLMDANGKTLQTNDDNFDGNNEFGIAWQVSPGTYYLAVAAWEPSVTTTTPYSITTSFTTATTNHTSMWWAGDAESGWGINVNHQGNTIFGAMFNYEAAGLGTQNPNMWLVSTAAKSAGTDSYSGALLRVQGRAFNAPATNPGVIASSQVGNMRLDFSGANSGTLTYDVAGAGTGGTGATITKNISRLRFATLPVCEFTGSDRSFVFNYQDLWWNPTDPGWGVSFTHQSNIIFATLYTYEAGAGTLNKGMWLTATLNQQPFAAGTMADIYQGDLLRVTGSAFNAAPFIALNPAANTTRVGNMRVEFTTGNAAKLTYDVNDQQVIKNIERNVFDAFKPACEAP